MEPFLYEPFEQNSRKGGTASKLASNRTLQLAAANADLNGYLDEVVSSLITENKKR